MIRRDRKLKGDDEIQASYRNRTNHVDDLHDDNLLRDDLLGDGRVKKDRTGRGRYQFEGTASDDELEDEVSDNLDEIGEAAKRLKVLGMAMGDELDHQNRWIDNIAGQTDRLDNKLRVNTDRVRCYSKLMISIFI
jgi:hypothetical protein